MTDALLYPRRSSPFLPGWEGEARFLHSSVDGKTGVRHTTFHTTTLGEVVCASGWMVWDDPFAGISFSHLFGHPCPVGRHPVLQTWCQEALDASPPHAQRVGYLSLLLDPDGWAERCQQQQARLKKGGDPGLLRTHLRSVALQRLLIERAPDSGQGPVETQTLGLPHIRMGTEQRSSLLIASGSALLTDPALFVLGMPPDSARPEQGWFGRVFAHESAGDWFGHMDRSDPLPAGAALLPFPKAPQTPFGQGNLVLSQTGWGDGLYTLWAEYDRPPTQEGAKIIAYHADFGVVPADPLSGPGRGSPPGNLQAAEMPST